MENPVNNDAENEAKILAKIQKRKEYTKKYWLEHKEQIMERRNRKVYCSLCNKNFTYENKSDHIKSKFHSRLAEMLKIKSETIFSNN